MRLPEVTHRLRHFQPAARSSIRPSICLAKKPRIWNAQFSSQQQRQRGWKFYSFHAPEVECIGKGKAAGAVIVGIDYQQDQNRRERAGGHALRSACQIPVPWTKQ